MEQLTHWKKNIDQNFICGEDLQSEIKGLKKEMVVTLGHFGDNEAFDQKKNGKTVVTGLYLKDESGKELFKPVVLNKTNAKFFIDETKSQFMEKWVGHKCVVFAQPDKRFGFVVRFKHYYPPAQITDTAALAKLNQSTTLAELQANWTSLTPAEKNLPTALALKEKLKGELK